MFRALNSGSVTYRKQSEEFVSVCPCRKGRGGLPYLGGPFPTYSQVTSPAGKGEADCLIWEGSLFLPTEKGRGRLPYLGGPFPTYS